ncbi:MAG: AMP-binding protein, partial [Burkholderiaceae bacterium]|nr:AMP-binding protein [Burkholderiaceae bacterium]
AALLNGATSCPIDLRGETPARIADWIGQTGITIYHSVPSIFRSLASAGRRFDSVRVVRLEGDRATRRDLELFRAHFGPRARVAVGLGATETGLVCQYFFDHDTELPEGVVPIGHAVDGVRVELRDTDGAPVATGTTGEIVVTSRFLATGYWRDPAADARAFGRADDASGERSYRTGDLGRFRADGCLEYLGRLDGRVRIGGQWVATAEVEAALASLPGVREAAVAAVDTDGAAPRLVAWFVPELLPAPSVSSLRRGLAARLPAQMLPSRFIALERLALGAHGKVDRTLLALPAPQRPHLDTEATEPRSLVQLRLRELWEELFGFGPIGVHDDFFELGGDSLLAMSMLERVEDICGRRVPPSVLLGAATIEHLARAVLQRSPELQAPIVAIRASGSRPPLFFLHGDYLSGGLYCLELSRHLGPEQPFYAIAPCGFDGEPPPASYEAMAERHLEAIRAVQPEGPYLLAGQCNGGLVAYEIARRLSAAGEQVALLAMIASSARNLRYRALWRSVELAGRAIGMPGPSRRHAFERLRSFLVHQRGLPPSRRLRHVAGKASALRREVSALAGRVAAEAAPARVAAAERPRAQVAAAERPPAPIAAADGVAGAREHLWEFYQRIDRGYVPRRYDGRISLIWPTEGDERAAEAARWWRRVVAGLDLYEIRGSHTSCLTRHVGELAGALRAAVERT